MTIQDEVMALVHEVPRPPDTPIPRGVSHAEIEALGQRIGMPIPDELRQWLARCNCPPIGPGGLFGICPENDFVDIEAHYRLRPHWRENGWIPVAGDGCGDYYVLDTAATTRSGHPILFLDHEEAVRDSCDTVSYVVASGLWPFLRYILLEESDAEYNIWDEQDALRADPGLADYSGAARPWET